MIVNEKSKCRVDVKNEKRQCQGITGKRIQCSRKVKEWSNFCYSHRKDEKPKVEKTQQKYKNEELRCKGIGSKKRRCRNKALKDWNFVRIIKMVKNLRVYAHMAVV